ncbi:unnamed protein product [Lepeophtheirus salmonis]|uniref:(salmon louse) hypothetical protein n=1 Tax=Lepeophtheirus salmonis TaxID=72036 RepID=A0A7R8CWS8_LEPSM|nr:unnamed protein product [Lepeophtheirus salmonis]CAF2955732.1 unnamed protein product [Lepeophtheirus salmonis]
MEADISEKVFSYIGIKDYEKLSLLLFEEVSLSPEKLNFPDWHFGSGSIPIIQTVINEDIDSCRVLLEVGVSPNCRRWILDSNNALHPLEEPNFLKYNEGYSEGSLGVYEVSALGFEPQYCSATPIKPPLAGVYLWLFGGALRGLQSVGGWVKWYFGNTSPHIENLSVVKERVKEGVWWLEALPFLLLGLRSAAHEVPRTIFLPLFHWLGTGPRLPSSLMEFPNYYDSKHFFQKFKDIICSIPGANQNHWLGFHQRWSGLSPAHHAVQLRNFELLQLLISSGADVNIEDHLLGKNTLHTLCYSLASNKPLSNEKTKINKNTPLHILSFKNSHLESIIKPLSTHPHINIDAVNEDGQTPLIIALENNFDELASFFIGIGSNLSSVNRHGETSLLIACRKNQVRLVLEMLETNKCPTRSRDIDNNTSFHLAASREREIRWEKTPMELARDGQFNSFVQLFQGKDSRNERNASL